MASLVDKGLTKKFTIGEGIDPHRHKLDHEGIVPAAMEALVVAPASLRGFEGGRETKLNHSLFIGSEGALIDRKSGN